MWVTDAGSKGSSSSWNGRPANLDVYLNAMLAFAGHNSQTVNMTANELWNKFFRDAFQCSREILVDLIISNSVLSLSVLNMKYRVTIQVVPNLLLTM